MKILAITKRQPGATSRHIQALQVPEALAVWRHMRDGFVREIYFDPDRPAVVLVLEASSTDDARARLATLPMVAQGQIDFEILVLGHYSQLSHLFGEAHRSA